MNPLDFITLGQKRHVIDYLREHDGEEYTDLAVYVSSYIGREVTPDQLKSFHMDDLFA